MSDNDEPIADVDPRDLERICLMSAISGQLMRAGQPIKNARVKQSVSRVYNEGFVEKETLTDEQGYFEFPAIFEDKKPFVMIPSFSIGQTLTVYEDDEEHDFWIGSKRDGLENTESKGKQLEVLCEMNAEEKNQVFIDESFYLSHCKWNVVSDEDPYDF